MRMETICDVIIKKDKSKGGNDNVDRAGYHGYCTK